MMKKVAIWACVACMAVAARGAAPGGDAVPRGFAYQGILSDPLSGPLSGPQRAAFRIFEDASGGDAQWSTNLDVWCSADGMFHAWFAGDDSLLGAFSKPQRLLEVQVEGHGEAIAPRIAFTSVPQALLACRARQSPISFPVSGALSAGKAEVADAVAFEAGATFGSLSVSGDAAWTNEAAPLTVSNTVSGGIFSGHGLPPVGSIVMWPDQVETIPYGWALCDGNWVNGIQTPDLRDRFPVGVDGSTYKLGGTGGTNEVVLTTAQLPAHQHEYDLCNNRVTEYADGKDGYNSSDPAWWHDSESVETQKAGGDSGGTTKGHENRPPYYAVCFIMRIF